MKTNNIMHKIFHSESNLKMTISICLDDECKNGHADFSITAMAKEYYNGRYHDSFGGCCHDEILKRYPELKMFVDLHSSDSNGCPMYAHENGFYHLWDESKTEAERFRITKEYLRINNEEVKELAKTKCKAYFHYTIEKLGLPKRWKAEAKKAIKELERLGGQKWDTSYKWERSQYIPMTVKEKNEVKQRLSSGYYSSIQIKKREDKEYELIKRITEAGAFDQPRVGDSVEMIDMSKTFGVVKKIVDNDEVEIDWGSGEGEEGIKVEKITDLALVKQADEIKEDKARRADIGKRIAQK